MNLYEKLKRYQASDAYPFHMPGHKRNQELMKSVYGEDMGNPFALDITEIDGFDDLHHAGGILKEAMEQMAGTVGALHSYFVVNGSSGGILAAMYGGCGLGSKAAVARNCHRSVAHGIQLRQLVPYYIYPKFAPKLGITLGITCEDVEDILEKYGDISSVLVTSPTYEGIVSDIRSIAGTVHRHGAILIVDEAHGAHLPFGYEAGLAQSAITQGADLVIQSLHKTLPALTQCAALHICSERVDRKRVEQGLRIFETSSPSYVMMAGMDACMRFMKSFGEQYLNRLCGWLDAFYRDTLQWEELLFLREEDVRAWGRYWFDRTKVVFSSRYLPGFGQTLYGWMVHDYHLQPEMATPDYVVLMTTIGDTPEGFARLSAAMEDMNRRLKEMRVSSGGKTKPEKRAALAVSEKMPRAKARLLPYEAAECPRERIAVKDACGRISAEMAYIYPPGIPFLMPGELVSQEHVELMAYYRDFGREIHGLEDEEAEYLWVTAE